MSCLALAVSLLFFKATYPEPIFLSLCSSFMWPLTFIFCSAPLFHLPSWTPLSPLVPVVQSQTNGAHYSCAKNNPAAKSVQIFFFSVSHLSPIKISLLASLAPPGGKWVMARRLVSSFINWQLMCNPLWCHGWRAEAVGQCNSASSPGWLARCHGSWPRAHGTRWKWICGKCFWLQWLWTLPCGQAGDLNLQQKQTAGDATHNIQASWIVHNWPWSTGPLLCNNEIC